MARAASLSAVVALLAVVAPSTATADADRRPSMLAPEVSSAPHAPFVAGEVVVRFRTSVGARARARIRRSVGGGSARSLSVPGLELVRIERAASVASAVAKLEADPRVLYAEPNHVYRLAATPNDPLFPQLWALRTASDADIDATEAWDVTTGSGDVTVAVVDTGVDYGHPDLAGNAWTNPGESGAKASNGVDDDGNGVVDDWRGWDWVADDNAPLDENGHGTHVAGTIGAVGDNGIGSTGVAWRVSLMPLRAGDGRGLFTEADVVRAFAYAARSGARVVNASFGGPSYSQAILDVIEAYPETLFVAAAGNGGADALGDDNDFAPLYPCSYRSANLVCVAASDASDRLASFSNFGVTSVDLVAPGRDILSTLPGGEYAMADGTSMAAPHVAGAAALLLAHRPALATPEARSALLGSVDPIPSLACVTAARGRLNAFRALTWSAPPLDVTPPTNPTLASPSHALAVWSRDRTVDVSFTGASDSGRGVEGYSYTWSSNATSVPDTALDTDGCRSRVTSPSLADGRSWYFHLRTRDRAGNWSAAVHLGPFFVDTTAPTDAVVGGAALAAPFQLSRPFGVAWGARDATSGAATFDVVVRRTRYDAYDGTEAVWRNATPATRSTFVGSPGFTYCFSVRARDRAGNASAWSRERCTALPVASRALVHRGAWAKRTGRGHYLNSYSLSRRRGARLARVVQGRTIALVVTKCPGCGTIRVSWDTGVSKRISLAARTVRKKRLVPVTRSGFVRTFSVKVVVASSRRPVKIEGLAVTRG